MSDRDLSAFAVIVLAAGSSTRMMQGNKLTQLVGTRPMVCHALDTVTVLRPAEVIVVTGYERSHVEELLRDQPVKPVFNPEHKQGMGSSLAVGAKAVRCGLAGVFVHLADVPFVAAETYLQLANAMDEDSAANYQIFAPVFAGLRGHPVLFRSAVLPALRQLSGDIGARALIKENACKVVTVDDRFIASDVDTEEDLRQARSAFE